MKKWRIVLVIALFSCETKNDIDLRTTNFPKRLTPATNLPSRENFWIFILAGQSNMAGRGMVEPEDTIPSPRIYTIDKNNHWIIAKEPLHFYEPARTGLDCGLSFAKELLTLVGDSISIGLIPCAVGGSSVEQWLGDSIHRDVKLFTNFKEKVALASAAGTVKGILWHQGEANAQEVPFRSYEKNLQLLFQQFRKETQQDSLPILVGELGSFLDKGQYGSYPDSVNRVLHKISESDKHIFLIKTGDLQHKGDTVHFDSPAQRELGKRFARAVKNAGF